MPFRNAAEAVTISRTLVALAHFVQDFPPIKDIALETRLVFLVTLVANAEGEPPTASQIAKTARIPRSTVDNHLKKLVRAKCVSKIGNAYLADAKMLKLSHARIAEIIKLFDETVKELARSRRTPAAA